MLIYKIFRADEWVELQAQGETRGAPIDLTDGFVHFSTAAQCPTTAALYFAGVEGLELLAIETKNLCDALRWEASRGGDLFPHLYRTLRLSDVVWHAPLPWTGAVHDFPELA